jgi:Uma2 family endonuclease
MGTVAEKRRAPAPVRLNGELRWAVRDAAWDEYVELAERLPASFRVAFDGKDIEMMVTSRDHDQVGWLMARFAEAVIDRIGIDFVPCGRATWQKPESARGIEADECYLLEPAKIAVVKKLRAAKSKDESGYPTPDLAIEVDISPPKVDRPGIYAAMSVSELWRFDEDTPVIERLTPDGRYMGVEASLWLPVRVEHLRQWIVEEDSSGFAEWSRRMRAWVRKTYRAKRKRQ